LQGWEDGASKCPAIIAGILVLSDPKGGRLPSGSQLQERCNKIFNSGKQMNPTQEGCALETMVTAWNFIKWDKVRQFVKSLQRRIAKATNLLYIVGRFTPASESLSRMRRKLQVRFLGDKGGAIRLRYPTFGFPGFFL
jgi:hypothetical protein